MGLIDYFYLAGIYYCFNLVIIMMSVFLSSLVVNICQMGETGKPVPKWLRKVMLDSHHIVPDILVNTGGNQNYKRNEKCTEPVCLVCSPEYWTSKPRDLILTFLLVAVQYFLENVLFHYFIL